MKEYIYSDKEKLDLAKAFEFVGGEEYRMVREEVDPDNTASERFIDNKWNEWLLNAFSDFSSDICNNEDFVYLNEKAISNMGYHISNEFTDWSDECAVEFFYANLGITPFDIVKWIVRYMFASYEDEFESKDIETLKEACDEIFESEGIDISKELIESEFMKAFNLPSIQ